MNTKNPAFVEMRITKIELPPSPHPITAFYEIPGKMPDTSGPEAWSPRNLLPLLGWAQPQLVEAVRHWKARGGDIRHLELDVNIDKADKISPPSVMASARERPTRHRETIGVGVHWFSYSVDYELYVNVALADLRTPRRGEFELTRLVRRDVTGMRWRTVRLVPA